MKLLRQLPQVILCNIVVAIIPTILLAVFRDATTLHDVGKHFQYSLVYTFCIGTPTWLVMERIGPRIINRRRIYRMPALIAVLALLALAGSILANLIFMGLGWQDATSFWPEFLYGLRIALLLTVLLGVIMTVFEMLSARLRAAEEELRRRQLEDERARQLVTQARLSLLESRIHPHFLFNTLNSISALIREDPRKAELTVERLATLLRYSLDHSARGLAPLRKELRVVEDYLEIEKTRFGDRLRFSLDVPEELMDVEVPPLALQTLVENSIKHAVARSRQGGEIRVSASMAEGHLRLEVSDDGPGFDRSAFQPGHGLENLEGRLAALFDGEGRLEATRRDGRMVVGVTAPCRKAPA